jgi:ubiquinone/menaquinone biosynthesis C-methylase UbiE
MEWNEEAIKQCPKPEGDLGRTVAIEMNSHHEELWRWGLSFIDIKDKMNILDVGCGGGKAINIMSSLAEAQKIIGIDYSKDMVQFASDFNQDLVNLGLVEIIHGDVSSLPFLSDTFDLITAFETYYFWPNLIDSFKEVRRVLKPGGTFLLVNETYKHEKFEERNSSLARIIKMRYNTPEELTGFLIESGFDSTDSFAIPEKNWITSISTK